MSNPTDTLAATFQRVLTERDPAFDAWFYEYCKGLDRRAEAEKYDRYFSDLLAFAGYRNLHGVRMLEAGCGFGFGLIWCALRGGEAFGIDIYEPMIRTIGAYRRLLPDDLGTKIEAKVGDVAQMPFEDESFDVVAVVEAVSHYTDVDAFVREALRVLRPGGVLVMTDSNNARNPRTRRRKQAGYRAVELGPVVGPATGVGVFTEPFIDKRRHLIRESFDLDASTVDRLAELTSGMTRAQVLSASDRYVTTGELPASPFHPSRAPIDPESDTVIERLIDPYAFARQLREAGFRTTRVEGYWGGASGKPHLRVANAVLARLSPIVIWTTPTFRVAARR